MSRKSLRLSTVTCCQSLRYDIGSPRKLLCSHQSHVLLSRHTLSVIALYKTFFPPLRWPDWFFQAWLKGTAIQGRAYKAKTNNECIDVICLLTSVGGRGWSLICPLKLESTPSLCCPCIRPLKYFLLQIWPLFLHRHLFKQYRSQHCFVFLISEVCAMLLRVSACWIQVKRNNCSGKEAYSDIKRINVEIEKLTSFLNKYILGEIE